MNDEVKLYSSSTLVSAATVLTGGTLAAGGNDSMVVSSGGTANSTTLISAGLLYVSSGGAAYDTTLNDDGRMFISSGGMAKNIFLNSNGKLKVSGGVLSGTLQIKPGALVSVNSDTVIDFTVSEQTAPDAALVNNWNLISGGADAAYTITVKADQTLGEYILAENASAFSNIITVTTEEGALFGRLSVGSSFDCGGKNYLLVCSSGTLALQLASGSSAGPVISSGWHYIGSGEILNNATVISGGLDVNDGGVANYTTISGGAMVISSGGTANSTTMSGGSMEISGGGIADNTTISSGGEMTVFNSYKTGYIVAKGGLASNTNISNGGILRVGDIHYNYYSSAAVVVSNVIHSGGSMAIHRMGSASDSIVCSGGNATVLDGGCAVNTTLSGGKLWLREGGSANQTTVESNGALFVGFNAIAENLTVNGGGVYVMGGGEVKGDISISQSGGLYLYGGSIVEGDIHVKGTLYVDETMVNNGKITIELNENPLLCSMVENLDYMNGTDNFSVETNGLDSGCYRIACGAGDYNGTITVENDGFELGTLAIGETKDFGGINYSLARNNDELEIRLGAVVRITAKSDIDDSGISDVMFQYTGGDYQIGFWMNGTNTWQGQGISQPSNWELLGAYDMDQNGKADIVMRGNVTIGGAKGAYIGYYKDGDVTQWQNISFLNNPDDIDWRLAIGNVTGNEGCNSIVWHAPELGALGVWTDGTSNWVSLAGGFDSSWTMLGGGDFDGNGKDEILFSNSGNLYTTDIDQKFASLGGWGSDWEVKTIGDFSGDNQDDIILQNGNMVVKFENGLAENWSSIGVMDAKDWFIVGAGDYNGDFEDDLLVRQYSTGMLGYYESGDMSKWVELGRGVDMNWTVIA